MKLLLIGCGRMGSAMLQGWIREGVTGITVVEPHLDAKTKTQAKKAGVTVLKSVEDISAKLKPDVVVIAIKPQMMTGALPAYSAALSSQTVVISIAAGKTIASISKLLKGHKAVVRAMPNLPATIGKSVTVLVASAAVSAKQKKLAEKLLGAVGATLWLSDEKSMDAVTAVSGSGPAYLYYFLECWMHAAMQQGFSREQAQELVIGTAHGAMQLLVQSGKTCGALRAEVTSPGGTTEAALQSLSEKGLLEGLLRKALDSAVERGKMLAKK